MYPLRNCLDPYVTSSGRWAWLVGGLGFTLGCAGSVAMDPHVGVGAHAGRGLDGAGTMQSAALDI